MSEIPTKGAEQAVSVESKVMSIIAENLGVLEKDITLESRFIEDLSLDSLDRMQMVMAMEDAFNVEIPDDQSENLKCVKDAVDYINVHKK